MVRLNKIYTRTGDDGSTGLVDGARVLKDAARITAIGRVDEANSAIGAAAVVADEALRGQLARIQNDMFDLGADLATPVAEGDDFTPSDMALRIAASQTAWLERGIDTFNERLRPLTSFVLPGGSEAAARLHVARASVRAAERAMVALAREERVNPAALSYINRLSDWLFTAARTANSDGADDVTWVPGANR